MAGNGLGAPHGDSDTVVLYTHAGIPAYMGMNGYGLSVLWQFVGGDERGPGVPTTVLIRELLAQRSAAAAAELLCRAPRTLPNNFILTDQEQAINVEATVSHCTTLALPRGFVVHTN